MLRQARIQGICSLFAAQKDLGASKALTGDETTPVLCGLCYMDLVGEKGQMHGARLGIPGYQLTVS